MIHSLILAGALAASAPAIAEEAAAPAPSRTAEVLRRYPAPEARQGVAVDATHVYAVANSTIAKYDKKSGAKVAEWKGDPVRYPHINSCAVIAKELVCASSNFPAVPHWSAVEFFDPATMKHLRTVALGAGRGSITWVDRKDGAGGRRSPTTTARAARPRATTATRCWFASTTTGARPRAGASRNRCSTASSR